MELPGTEDMYDLSRSSIRKTLQEDMREKAELERLKFELRTIETLLTVPVEVLEEDSILKR